MSQPRTVTPREAPAAAERAPRLRPGTRKAVLAVHLISMGAWIGIDVVLAVLILTGLLAAPGPAAVALQALPLLALPMFLASLVCLLSGVTLSVYSRYGLLRYWWVSVKLAINVLFCALIVFSLAPGLDTAAAHGRALAAGVPDGADLSMLLYPVIVSPTGLVVSVLLAGYRPWGRIRRG